MRFMSVSAVVALTAGLAQGSIVGTGGSATVVPAPPSTALGALESNTQAWTFNEVVSLTLASALPVNATTPGVYTSNGVLTPGMIPAGTVINSHYIYSDPVGGSTETYEGFVDFDQPILGVIVLRADLNGSDFLGAPGTLYADNAARGMELSTNADRFTITISQTRVSFRFSTSTATDDIRVITTPAPGAMGLCGLGTLLLVRRRR